MKAINGTYSPTILRGRVVWRGQGGERPRQNYYRLVSVVDGEHRMDIDGRQLVAGPGQTYLLQPGIQASIQPNPMDRAQMIAFVVMACRLRKAATNSLTRLPADAGHRQPLPQAIWGVELPVVLADELSPWIAGQMQLMTAIWWRDPWDLFRANMRLVEVLERVVEHYRLDARPAPADDADNWLRRVQGLVRERLAAITSTADLAAGVGLSPDYFAKKFRAATGETPAAFLRRERLNEAAVLVRNTTWSIEHIARHVGYRSAAALDKAWAKRFPVPPLKWRQQNA